MDDFHTVEPYVEDTLQYSRLLSRQYLPSSIQAKSLSPIKLTTQVLTASATINNNSGVMFNFSTASTNGNAILVSMDCSIFIGSTTDPASNLLPGGSAVNASAWKVAGPINTPYSTNGLSNPGANQFNSRVQIRNLSGVPQVVTVVRSYKYAANAGDVA